MAAAAVAVVVAAAAVAVAAAVVAGKFWIPIIESVCVIDG